MLTQKLVLVLNHDSDDLHKSCFYTMKMLPALDLKHSQKVTKTLFIFCQIFRQLKNEDIFFPLKSVTISFFLRGEVKIVTLSKQLAKFDSSLVAYVYPGL